MTTLPTRKPPGRPKKAHAAIKEDELTELSQIIGLRKKQKRATPSKPKKPHKDPNEPLTRSAKPPKQTTTPQKEPSLTASDTLELNRELKEKLFRIKNIPRSMIETQKKRVWSIEMAALTQRNLHSRELTTKKNNYESQIDQNTQYIVSLQDTLAYMRR